MQDLCHPRYHGLWDTKGVGSATLARQFCAPTRSTTDSFRNDVGVYIRGYCMGPLQSSGKVRIKDPCLCGIPEILKVANGLEHGAMMLDMFDDLSLSFPIIGLMGAPCLGDLGDPSAPTRDHEGLFAGYWGPMTQASEDDRARELCTGEIQSAGFGRSRSSTRPS